MTLGPAGVVIEVRYQAARDLGDIPVHTIVQGLRTELGMPDLTLKTERKSSVAERSGKAKTSVSKAYVRSHILQGSCSILAFMAA